MNSYESLLEFLNGPEPEEPEDRQARATLRECVDLIVRYNWDLYEAGDLPELGHEAHRARQRADELHRSIFMRLTGVLTGEKLTVIPPSYLDQEEITAADTSLSKPPEKLPRRNLEKERRLAAEGLRRVITPNQPLIRALTKAGLMCMEFYRMLSDPKAGVPRIFRCEYKDCSEIQLGRYALKKPQRFCPKPKQCAAKFANEHTMASYMREWRKTDALQELRREDGESWECLMQRWNKRHPKKHHKTSWEYQDPVLFQRDWEAAQADKDAKKARARLAKRKRQRSEKEVKNPWTTMNGLQN